MKIRSASGLENLLVIDHKHKALGMRLLGLGPNFVPCQSIHKLQSLFRNNTFWAQHRSRKDIRIMLKNSDIIISVWKKNQIVGFGRAQSDGIYRAVLWDVIVANEEQRSGLGKLIIQKLLSNCKIKKVDKIYAMTTKSKLFYIKMGFRETEEQKLMVINKFN